MEPKHFLAMAVILLVGYFIGAKYPSPANTVLSKLQSVG